MSYSSSPPGQQTQEISLVDGRGFDGSLPRHQEIGPVSRRSKSKFPLITVALSLACLLWIRWPSEEAEGQKTEHQVIPVSQGVVGQSHQPQPGGGFRIERQFCSDSRMRAIKAKIPEDCVEVMPGVVEWGVWRCVRRAQGGWDCERTILQD